MPSPFTTACSVAATNTYNTDGSVTLSKIGQLKPSDIEGLFRNTTTDVWYEMRSFYKHQIEMQACGIRRSPFYEWLISSAEPGLGNLVTVERIQKGPSLVRPFILGRQLSLWNVDHFTLSANVAGSGYSAPGAGTGYGDANPGPGLTSPGSTNRCLTVSSTYGGSTLNLHPDYFLPGKKIHLVSLASGSAYSITQFKIVAAARNTDTTLDIEVVVEQPASTSEGGTLASASFTPNSTATSGVIFLGINNVHDVESWCKNMINVNLEKRVPFWYQYHRHTRAVSDQYEKLFKKLFDENELYGTFADLSMAERNRQDEMRSRVEWCNAVLFGERYNNKQNLDNWASLPDINSITGATVDPGTGNAFIAKRANMIGILPQLKDCGRFSDKAAQDFNLKTFLESDLYDIHRARDGQGRASARQVDLYMSSDLALQFQIAFIAYSKSVVGDIARINMEQGVSEWGFPFFRYRLYKPQGVTVNVVTDPVFDDYANAFSGGNASLGNMIWTLDLGKGGSIRPGLLGSNRKQYTVGQIEDLAKVDSTFSCAMENPTIKKTLTSQISTVIVECPANNRIDANFGRIVSGVTS